MELCLPRGIRRTEIPVRVAEMSILDLVRLWEIFKVLEIRIVTFQELL